MKREKFKESNRRHAHHTPYSGSGCWLRNEKQKT